MDPLQSRRTMHELNMPRRKTIRQFMWPYQHTFQSSLESTTRRILREIGIDAEIETTLVGCREDGTVGLLHCVQPEDGPYGDVDFSDLPGRTAAMASSDPDAEYEVSDAISRQLRHSRLFRRARGRAIHQILQETSYGMSYVFFGDECVTVNGSGYAVYPIISIPKTTWSLIPRLIQTRLDFIAVEPSFADAVISEILRQSYISLHLPDPGRSLIPLVTGASEVLRTAANLMVRTTLMRAGFDFGEDYDLLLSGIAALPYEGRPGTGQVVIARKDDPDLELIIELKTPFELRDTRAIRKLIEASGPHGQLLSDGEHIYGFGRISDSYDRYRESIFVVTIEDRGSWSLGDGETTYLSVVNGEPRLPATPLNLPYLTDLMDRYFPDVDPSAAVSVARRMTQHHHGAMLIVSADADGEAARLAPQAWGIEPKELSGETIDQLLEIDGALLLSPDGRCHAVGAILDGRSCGEEDPARGSRYNNAIRYLHTEHPPAIVIVYSSDRTIDILPRIPPRVDRQTVLRSFYQFLVACSDPRQNYAQIFRARDRVKLLAFYLSEDQCRKVNEATRKVEEERKRTSNIHITHDTIKPDPRMNDTYWLESP